MTNNLYVFNFWMKTPALKNFSVNKEILNYILRLIKVFHKKIRCADMLECGLSTLVDTKLKL